MNFFNDFFTNWCLTCKRKTIKKNYSRKVKDFPQDGQKFC